MTNQIHVKICGLTNLEDASVALEAGADLLGFILYAKSPRYTAPEKVAEILRTLRQRHMAQSPVGDAFQSAISRFPKTVGVFVHEPVEKIIAILAEAGLDYAQLHSDEPPEMLAHLAGRAFKALRPIDQQAALADAQRYAALGPPAGPSLLIDAYDPAAYGGTGKTADWHAAAAVARQHPGLLLAGGMTAENVVAAIRTVRAFGRAAKQQAE